MPFSGELIKNPIIYHDDQSERQRKFCLIPPLYLPGRKRVPYATSLTGSLTVEAAFVVPMLIIAFTSIMYIIQIINLSINIQYSLYEQSMKIAGYSYFTQQIEDKLIEKTGINGDSELLSFVSNTLTSSYVKNMVVDDIGYEYLDNSCIVGGKSGLYAKLTPDVDDNTYDITLYYSVEVPLNWFGINSIKLASRAYIHMWTGMEQESDKSDIVYMTTNGDVYHLYSDCSYISVKLYQTTVSQVADLRNKSGAKYYPCSSCCSDTTANSATVYYSLYGNRYHTSKTCTHIERDVIEVNIETVMWKMNVCSKCLKRSNNQ